MPEISNNAAEPAYDLLLVTCRDLHPDTPLVRSERRLEGISELDEVLAALDPQAFSALLLTRVLRGSEEECDDGSFRLLLATGRADIHLCDGGCSTVRDPAPEAEKAATTQVMLESGEFMEVARRNTVGREDGVAAIRYWMECGEQLPRLNWGPG
jgi:hypothetical protein